MDSINKHVNGRLTGCDLKMSVEFLLTELISHAVSFQFEKAASMSLNWSGFIA